MGNELQTTGNNELANRSQIDNRVRNLEDGGYYKNVVSPEEYLSKLKESGDSELELSDEDGNVSSSELSTPQKVEPLKHWNVNIQRKFDSCSESQQKAWLDSFKIVEKSYVKQLNNLKDQIAISEIILEPLIPYVKDLKKLGKKPQDYIREIIEFDEAVGKNPAYEIAKLIVRYNLNYDTISKMIPHVNKDIDAENVVFKYIKPLKEEIAKLKGDDVQSAKIQKEAQDTSDEIVNKITTFYNQTDSSGKLLYPKAFDFIEDILELVQTGENLDTAYNLVLNGQRADESDNSNSREEVEYDEPIKKKRKLNALEEEKQMLRNTLNKLRG
jgi:hypothetical protein